MSSWILFSILAAFGQALGWAFKKKALSIPEANITLGLVSYLAASVALFVLWSLYGNFIVPPLADGFTVVLVSLVSLNVLAQWSSYRALDLGSFSKLMPFVPVSALGIIPVEYILRGVLPTIPQIYGVALIVLGSIIFSHKSNLDRDAWRAGGYFVVTLLCYTVSAPLMAVVMDKTGDPLFSAVVMHFGIAFGFLFLWILTSNTQRSALSGLRKTGRLRLVLIYMIVAGVIVGFLENGATFVALMTSNASEVFAIKRIMPVFALVLGIFMFHETVHRRHGIGTLTMIAGAVLVILYK